MSETSISPNWEASSSHLNYLSQRASRFPDDLAIAEVTELSPRTRGAYRKILRYGTAFPRHPAHAWSLFAGRGNMVAAPDTEFRTFLSSKIYVSRYFY